MAVVMIGWVFFRAATLTYAAGFLSALAGAPAGQATPYTVGWYLTSELWLALIAGVVGSTPWVPTLASWLQQLERPWVFATEALSVGALVALFVASITQVAAGTYNSSNDPGLTIQNMAGASSGTTGWFTPPGGSTANDYLHYDVLANFMSQWQSVSAALPIAAAA